MIGRTDSFTSPRLFEFLSPLYLPVFSKPSCSLSLCSLDSPLPHHTPVPSGFLQCLASPFLSLSPASFLLDSLISDRPRAPIGAHLLFHRTVSAPRHPAGNRTYWVLFTEAPWPRCASGTRQEAAERVIKASSALDFMLAGETLSCRTAAGPALPCLCSVMTLVPRARRYKTGRSSGQGMESSRTQAWVHGGAHKDCICVC